MACVIYTEHLTNHSEAVIEVYDEHIFYPRNLHKYLWHNCCCSNYLHSQFMAVLQIHEYIYRLPGRTLRRDLRRDHCLVRKIYFHIPQFRTCGEIPLHCRSCGCHSLDHQLAALLTDRNDRTGLPVFLTQKRDISPSSLIVFFRKCISLNDSCALSVGRTDHCKHIQVE